MTDCMWAGPTIEMPANETLPSLADGLARRTPDAIVLVDGVTGATMSAGELAKAYRKAARGLVALGFGKGDCLCTLMPNDMTWYVAALAAQSLGGAISGINPMASPGEIQRQFAQLPAKVILAAPPLIEVAKAAAGALGLSVLSTTAGRDDVAAILEIDGPEPEPRAISQDDVALMPFSSGTSGLPKAAIVTHRNLVAAGTQIPAVLGYGRGSIFLGLPPLFHIVGPSLLPAALLEGGSIVVVPRLDAELIFDAIERFGVTHMPLLTPILRMLSLHPAGDGRDFSRLRVIGAGGSAMAPTVHEEATRRFGCAVVQVYGMTETSSIICVDDPAGISRETVGRPVANLSIRIVDPETLRPCVAGESGEVQARGPNIISGYFRNEAESKALFTDDGWMRTGDIGRFDETGKLTLTGRIKEMIKVNSAQVAPAELEMLLCGHPAVVEAAVVGRGNPYCGEVPVAFLVLKEPADPFVIIDAVNDQVIRYKRIRDVRVVEALPKNATGKIDRKALAGLGDMHLSDHARAA